MPAPMYTQAAYCGDSCGRSGAKTVSLLHFSHLLLPEVAKDSSLAKAGLVSYFGHTAQ